MLTTGGNLRHIVNVVTEDQTQPNPSNERSDAVAKVRPHSLAVSDEDWALWEATAKRRGVSVSKLVRDAVNADVRAESEKIGRAALLSERMALSR